MLQTLKVFLLRKFYLLINARAWKGRQDTSPFSALEVSTPSGAIKLRMYANNSNAERPLIVFFHGGGWVVGDLETHHPFCQTLHEHSACTVIAVDYRLAPENPFPAAQDDCVAATAWIAEHIKELGTSNGQMVLAGDSAGGHLTIATTLDSKPEMREKIAGNIAIYPVTDYYNKARPSYVDKAKGYTLTTNMMRWFWDSYLPPTDDAPTRATPLHSPAIDTLPPTLLVTAEHDPLRDEGIAFADKLKAEQVDLRYRHFPNAEHGFACSAGPGEDHKKLMKEISDWLENLEV